MTLPSITSTTKAKSLLKQKSMAFGRLISGYPVSMAVTNKKSDITYRIANYSSDLFPKRNQDDLDGYFFVFLPAGDYAINEFTVSGMIYAGNIRANMNFTLKENSAVYLGTVTFEWQKTNNYLVVQKGIAEYKIKDEWDDAIDRLWRRFPELKEQGLNVIRGLINVPSGHPASSYMDDFNEEINLPNKDNEDEGGFKYQPLTSKDISKVSDK